MKIICSKETLLKAIGIVARAVPTRTTLPILECLKLDAADNSISLMANNMDIAVKTEVAGRIEEAGDVAIPAKLFGDIIRKLPDGELSVTADSTTYVVTIESGRNCKFSVAGRETDNYPELPEVKDGTNMKIPMPDLKRTIGQVIFATAQGDSGMMGGVCIEMKGNSVRFVAIDGHRIAVRDIALESPTGTGKHIVPGKALAEIVRFPVEEEDVELSFTDSHVLFTGKDITLVARLVNGEYYDYQKIIDSSEDKVVVSINRDDLATCVDRAMLFFAENDKKPLVFEFAGDECRFAIKAALGSMSESVPVTKDGDDLTIGFNPRLIFETLKAIEDDEVVMRMATPKSPCVIKDEAGTYTYLVLPVNMR